MAMACEAARRHILDRIDRIERTERVDRADRPERADPEDLADLADLAGQVERPDQLDRSGARVFVAGVTDASGFTGDAADAADAAALDAHVAGCAACAAFEARLQSLDEQLSEMFVPPVLSEGFRASLHTRIRHERRRVWMDALPELVHVAGCGALMGAAALLVPPSAPIILSAGTMLALLTYVPLLALRNAFDE